MRRKTDGQLTFAHLEFESQGVVLEPHLLAISEFLHAHPELTDLVHADLVRGLKRPGTGRPGLPADAVLRALVLMRVKDWDYRELRARIAEGHTLRDFVGVRMDRIPRHDAFQRAISRLRPKTIREIVERTVKAAAGLGIEEGGRLRIDTMVVETDIRHPTDAGLLWDTVRVLTRLVRRLGEVVPEARAGFHDRCRRAKRRAYEINRLSRVRKDRKPRMRAKYKELIAIAEEVLAMACAAAERGTVEAPGGMREGLLVEALAKEIEHFRALGLRVVDQARRRVLRGETVPAREKVLSLFEPHTDIIVRTTAHPPVRFGHKVFLAETGSGLIADYRVLDGNPKDEEFVGPALQKHEEVFGVVPEVFAGDRGFYSRKNVDRCADAGVETESIPYRGGRKPRKRAAYEKKKKFKDAQRFRNGVEGRISVLIRGRGMGRCRWKGRDRFEAFVGSAVLANNLLRIAAALLERKTAAAGSAA